MYFPHRDLALQLKASHLIDFFVIFVKLTFEVSFIVIPGGQYSFGTYFRLLPHATFKELTI